MGRGLVPRRVERGFEGRGHGARVPCAFLGAVTVLGCCVGMLAWGQEVAINRLSGGWYIRVGSSGSGLRFVWDGNSTYCPGYDVVHRPADLRGRFTADEACVASSSPGFVGPLDIAVLPSGSFLVVGKSGDIYARAYDPAANPLGPEFVVNQTTAGLQGWPRVAALASSRYAVVWNDTSLVRTIGRIVMEDGSMAYPEQLISSDQSNYSDYADVSWTQTGGVIAMWRQTTTSNPQTSDVRVRLFDQTFAPLGPDIVVSAQDEEAISAVATGPGGFLAAYYRGESGVLAEVRARILDASGQPIGTEIAVNTYTPQSQGGPEAGMDAAGNFVICWSSNGQDGSGDGVYCQRFDAGGGRVGGEFRASGSWWDVQSLSGLEVLPTGDFVPVWYSYQTSTSTEVLMRRYFFPLSLVVAPGKGGGNPPTAWVLQPDGQTQLGAFSAYGSSAYGANVGAGDIDSVGVAEVLTGPGPSPVYGPHVKAWRPNGTLLQKVSFYAYGTLKYGVRASGGSIDTDSFSEILTAPGEGIVFGPHIRAWDYDGTTLRPISKVNFYAYSTLRYGARVAGGEVDGDTSAEILTAPGPGAVFTPNVRGFNYDGLVLASIPAINFNAFNGPMYGATVSASDVESDGHGVYGDGYQEILAGVGPDPNPAVVGEARVFNYDNAAVAWQFTVQPAYGTPYGVNVAGGDIDAGDTEEVVTAPGPSPTAPAHVRVWEVDWRIGNSSTTIRPLGPDDFTTFASPPLFYGCNLAVGIFE